MLKPRLSLTILIVLSVIPAMVFATDIANISSAAITIDSNNRAVSLGFNLSQVEQQEVELNGDRFTTYGITGEGVTCEYGMPVLPAVSRFVIVPPDAGLELVYSADEPRRVSAPNPPALYDDEAILLGAERDDYQRNEIYPPVIAEMSQPAIMRGIRMVKITVYPVQYDPRSNEYLLHNNIQTDIRYTDDAPENPVRYPNRRYRSRSFMKVIDALAVNSDQIHRDDPDFLSPYEGHYLVVTHESCLQYAAPFIEWRRKSGYKVDILNLSSGNANNPATVQRGIQDLYDEYLEDGIDPFDLVLLIGDRSAYSYPPSPGWILQAQTGNTIWGGAPHADHLYACLEGNDQHPDVGISRLPAGSRDMMQLEVGRTMAYEAYPDMEDVSWFTRGGVVSQHWGNSATSAWHVTIHTNVRWGEEVLKFLGFDDITFHELYAHDQYGQQVGPVIRDLLNEGSNLIIGRAENYYFVPGRGNHSFDGEVDENTVFPLWLNTSGHGEWSCEIMFRTGSANNMKGYVACTYGWGGPPTVPMSAVWLELVKGVLLHDMPFGWGYSYSITAFEQYIPPWQWRNHPLYAHVKTDVDAFGDPGLQPWIGVPRIVEASFTPEIHPSTRMLQVYTFDPEDEEAVSGAQVTFYVPGDMPDFDDDDYADYEDMFMMTKKSDEGGIARFVLPDNVGLERGDFFVTVTGRDIVPFFGEGEIVNPDLAVDISEYSLTETEGNEDGELNPGETFSFTFTATNSGDDADAEGVVAVVSDSSPWIEVEENEIDVGDIESGASVEVEDAVIVTILPSCPDGELRPSTKPVLLVDFISGENSWSSGIELDVIAPNFMVRNIPDGIVIPDTVYRLDIDLENIGRLNSPGINAQLVSLGMGISVVESGATFPAINAGNHSRLEGQQFLIAGNRVVVPGYRNPMMLILANADEFVDTCYFDLQVMEVRENAPMGPDDYGYICFDDTDVDWEIAPEYDWVEICPEEDPDFEGEELDFEGASPENVGESLVIPLGFTTQFYGREYDSITVTTNGYIAIGSQPRITNFQNWPLDKGFGGGMGMIAPFWDWLRFGEHSAIYYYYDEDDSRGIIEWYKLRHYSENTELTFQVILYDKDVWITESGDPNILFQYHDIEQVRGFRDQGAVDWEKNIDYASVGISSPDGTTGISYSFHNEYPVNAAPLSNRRAILFSTSPRYKACILYGYVTDAANGGPIEGAVVFTKHGFTAFTDEEGYWRIGDALAEIPFDITAMKQGYNDSTQYDIEVPEGDSLRIDFNLLHPEFSPSTWNLRYMLDPGYQVELGFSITNTGNGPMDWKIERRLLGAANAPPWEYRQAFAVGEPVDDDHIEAMVFADQMFLVAGGNHDHNTIYRFDRNGALIDTFAQFNLDDSRGMRDMTWDGELVWGAIYDSVYGFTPDGELVSALGGYRNPIPNRPVTNIAYDFDRDVLWLSGTTTDIIALNRDNERVDSLLIDRHDLRIYGLSYWEDDPDGYTLYALARMSDPPGQMIYKFNPNTNDTMFVAQIFPERNSSPGGLFITNTYDVYSWVLMSMQSAGRDAGGDRIELWQIEARRDWFQCDIMLEDRIEADSGRIETGETFDFMLTLNSEELPDTLFQGEMLFYHNADSGRGHIYVDLDVIGPMEPFPFDLVSPANEDTLDSTLTVFTWNPSWDPNHGEEVEYQYWIKSLNDSLKFSTADTFLTLELDSIGFDLGIMYQEYTEWWVNAVSRDDVKESNQRLHFLIKEPSTIDSDAELPVEFGLESIYPNPFNSTTTITFGIDQSVRTRLIVYDLTGREVMRLYDGIPEVGYRKTVFNGGLLPSGIYLVQLESAGRVKIAKTALIK